jgi:hypothetical protein
VRVSNLRLEFETFSTGGTMITTPPAEEPQATLPSYLGFDYMESYYVDFEARPTQNVTGRLSVNILGHVAVNPIDEIFYENRGRERTIEIDGEPVRTAALERVRVYQAEVSWDDRWFQLDAFYRTGHLHWGFEGDFFGLYRDSYYGENIDIYNGEAPVGFEIAGKRWMEGFKVAYGPQLFWGANPSIFLKYQRSRGPFTLTGIFTDEFARQETVTSALAVPLPPTKKATLTLEIGRGATKLEVGGIWSGSTKAGEKFQIAELTPTGYQVFDDEVRDSDAYGGKVKLTVDRGGFRWYAQAAYFGIVADGGPITPLTFTGWRLKDSGWGNQANFLMGMGLNFGPFQVWPNFLIQKPLIGPIPSIAPPPGRPRNVLDDPFAVRGNRETVAGEILITYDTAPATWMWQWDNDVRENGTAISAGVLFRHLPTTQDATIGVLANGQTFAFDGAPPPHDLWEVHGRIASRLSPTWRLVGSVYGGPAQAEGSDPRLINRFGGDARISWGSGAFATAVKVNDWGPYDYHRQFNLTFPLQLMGDISYTLGLPRWFGDPQTKIGVRGTWRALDAFSPRFDCEDTIIAPNGEEICDPTVDTDMGTEWELRTYLHISL